MRLKEKKMLQRFAATLKKFSAQGAKKVDYGIDFLGLFCEPKLEFCGCCGREKLPSYNQTNKFLIM